jgi:hypothetical protein
VDLLDSTHVTLTFTSLPPDSAGFTYFMVGMGAAAANINSTNFTIGPPSAVASPLGTSFTPGDLSTGNPGNQDGYGTFNAGVNIKDSTTHSVQEITFEVTNNSGTWSFDSTTGTSNVLLANSNGQILSANIGAWDGLSSGFTNTGFSGDAKQQSTPPVVPEPSTIVLVALGAMGFLGYGLRRRLRK